VGSYTTLLRRGMITHLEHELWWEKVPSPLRQNPCNHVYISLPQDLSTCLHKSSHLGRGWYTYVCDFSRSSCYMHRVYICTWSLANGGSHDEVYMCTLSLCSQSFPHENYNNVTTTFHVHNIHTPTCLLCVLLCLMW
jgi:hypothetical protein